MGMISDDGDTRGQRRRLVMRTAALASVAAISLCGSAQKRPPRTAATAASVPRTAADLFQTTRIWTVELTVAPEDLALMEPQSPAGPQFGSPPPGGPPQGGPDFRPRTSMLLVPLLMMHGDANRDGKLSGAELSGLVGTWWDTWDREKRGTLDMGALTQGLKAAYTPPTPDGAPGQGGPMGPGPGPGGPGMGAPPRRMFEFSVVRAGLSFEGTRFAEVGLRYKGNNTFMESAGSQKRPFKIEMDRFVKGRKLAGVSTLNLHNNVTDPSFMNEVMAYQAFRQAGVPAPRTAYARVYLTVPGKSRRQYLGLYTLVENVDEDFAQANYGTRSGAIMKPVTPSLFGYMGDDWAPYKQVYDPKTKMSRSQRDRLLDLCRLVTSADTDAFAEAIGRYVDLDGLATFLAAAVWIGDQDSLLDMGQNLYLHLDPKSDRIQFIPWDQDHTWGNWFLAGSQEDREQLSIEHPWIGRKPFLERIFALPAFRTSYMANLRRLTDGPFTPERLATQVDRIAAAIKPAVRQESAAKLARLEDAVAGRRIDRSALRGPAPGMEGQTPIPADGPAAAFMEGMRWMTPIKPFVRARAASVKAQLDGASPGKVITSIGPPMGPSGPGPGFGDFGPWSMLAPVMMQALDRDGRGQIGREAFLGAFGRWTADGGDLTPEQLQAAVDRAFPMPEPPFPAGGPPPMFGGPDG